VSAVRLGLATLLVGVAGGILLADLGFGPGPPAAAAGAALLVCRVAVGNVGGGLVLVGVALVGTAAGEIRHSQALPLPANPRVSVASLANGDEHRLEGVVTDDPRPRADRLQLVLGELVVRDATGRPARSLEDRLLVWLPRGFDVSSGDRVALAAEVSIPEDFEGFAYREYLARLAVGGIARPRGIEILADPAPGIGSGLATVRAVFLDGLNDVVPEPEAALGAGILLGVRSSIAPEISEAFAVAGLTHVVAISGWNIAIVAAIVMALVRPLGRRPGGRWITAATAASVIGAYVLLTGASPSVVRAALMAGAMLVGRLGGTRAHATSALWLAALVMLLVAPAVLWDVGFQLSLLATAGLIWYGSPIDARLRRWPAWVREPVALTLAAQLTTLPVVLANFERLSLVAPISNVLVVPVVPLAMLGSAVAAVGGCIAGALDGPIGDAVAWLCGGAAWLVLRVMIAIGDATAAVPFASVPLGIAPAFAVAWYPLLALATWALRSDVPDRDAARVPDEAMTGAAAGLARLARPVPATLALVAVLGAISLGDGPDGQLHVTALDIGQGDAILIETPTGRRMLVDGGPNPELTLRRLGANLSFAARDLDLVVLSHPHQDHVAGLVDVLDRFHVGGVLHAGIPFENAAFDLLLRRADDLRVPVRLARAGDRLALDATTSIEVLYPSATDAVAPLPEGDINNGSVVLVLRSGPFVALLTGDAEQPVEDALVSRGVVPPVDLLKVGHHGSRTSSTPALLGAASPSVAIISAGVDNEYGHPAPETLAALGSVPGLRVHRTDLHGDVEVAAVGAAYRIRTDAGWGSWRPTRAVAVGGSIGPWPSPIARPSVVCWTMPTCPRASASTVTAWPGSPWRPPGWSPRPGSRSTAGWSRRPPSSTTSTSRRSGAAAASTASSAHDDSRRRATRSSRCRSPPTRSPPCSTPTASRSGGRR
jgi:competence protein ComEC